MPLGHRLVRYEVDPLDLDASSPIVEPGVPDEPDRLVANHPGNVTYRYHLGAALIKTGEVGRGRQELETALSQGPSAAEEAEIRALLAQR